MTDKIKLLGQLIDEMRLLEAIHKRNLIAINSRYPQEAIDDNMETDQEIIKHFNL